MEIFFKATDGNVMFDPTAVNSKIIELTKEKINLQNALALANSVQVIEGFTKFESPVQAQAFSFPDCRFYARIIFSWLCLLF